MLFFCAFSYLGGKNAMSRTDERTALCALNKALGYVPAAGHALLRHFGAAAPVFDHTGTSRTSWTAGCWNGRPENWNASGAGASA